MAEAGDGNIKVVVRCRPLNSRGVSIVLQSATFSHLPLQSLLGARSHSFVCKATRPFSTLQNMARNRTRSARQRGKQWRLVSTRVIGLPDRGMSLVIALSKCCMMISARSFWITVLRVSMRVSWLVSAIFLLKRSASTEFMS